MTSFAAAVLGGSGQVGGCVIRSLLSEPRCSSVLLLNRRHLQQYDGEARVKQVVVNMDNLESEARYITQTSFCLFALFLTPSKNDIPQSVMSVKERAA